MLYFDILEPIRVLPDADKGRLLVAMLEYGQSGIVPEFDGMLALAWGFVKPKIDKDEEAYKDSVIQREYAAFCKKRRRLNLPKIPFEEWLELPEYERERLSTSDNELQRPVDFVASRYPTTTTPTTPSTNTSTTTTTAAAATATTITTDDAAAAADSNVKIVGGELGKNVVFLSEAQIADLLDQMGMEAFDHYVEKLANFIITNDAHVKNHYETILKWWKEDSAVSGRNKRTDKMPKGASGKLGQAELEAIQRVLAEE
jgi:hypothetical protein